MTMLYAGIDVGFTGAISILDGSGAVVSVWDMPTFQVKKKSKKGFQTEIDEAKLRKYLSEYKLSCAFIEKSQTMKGQGLVSSGRYMCGYGIIRGICTGLNICYILVSPLTWKPKMCRGLPKGKEASIIRVKQLYPELHFPLKKDHGRCDSILIGRYGVENL